MNKDKRARKRRINSRRRKKERRNKRQRYTSTPEPEFLISADSFQSMLDGKHGGGYQRMALRTRTQWNATLPMMSQAGIDLFHDMVKKEYDSSN